MAKCGLSNKKISSKVMPLVPKEYAVVGCLVRGGWQHGDTQVFAIEKATGRQVIGRLNYLTKERFEVESGVLSTWDGGYSLAHI